MTGHSLKFKATFLALLITAVVVLATSLEIFLDYRDTEERSYGTAADITRVVERQTRDTVTYVDHSLDAASNLLRVSRSVGGIRQPEVWKVLRGYCLTLIGCRAIWIVDSDGKVVTQTTDREATYDVSDRALFQRARDTRKRYIDMAMVSRLPGSPILFSVSKPVYDSEGSFLAVVVVGMETTQLTSFFSLFGFSVEPAVAVYKSNAGLVARHPGMAEHVGKVNSTSKVFTTLLPKSPAGTFESLSPLDKKQRLAAYRALPDLDLVIFAGVEKKSAFAPWRARTLRHLTIIAGVLVLIWSALFAAYRPIAEQSVLRAENSYLDDLAFTDSLTGIGNRRLFDSTLKRDWSKHLRTSAPLSIVLMDIDCFKQFNDHYGHQAGDDCLRQIAQAIQGCLQRGEDLLARYGGEEFVAVLDCGREAAVSIADRMRRQVEALHIPHGYSEASSVVTASFGVSSTEGVHVQSVDELVTSADTALYAAKASGRNKVVSAHPLSHADNAI
ncbi:MULTISPECIES: sensor domain-containing diguanylate cyclase [unclassified Massilia]|uniref:sensor domain-containing diguanylate cyclase n=1 Tax=unclassified Massilia TaxID=2609279 RepID=UPI0009E9931A|nr:MULTISPECIES: sensor domain-containing diguanylate cyclase [unclassified Massilia]